MRKKYSAFVRLFVVLSMVLALLGLVVAPAGASPAVTLTATPEVLNTLAPITIEVSGVTWAEEWVFTATVDSIYVTVTSAQGSDTVSALLTETGAATGVFRGTVTLIAATASPVTNDTKLEVGYYHATTPSPVDLITVDYVSTKVDGGNPIATKTDTVLFDAEAPTASVSVSAITANVITLSISATDDPLNRYPTGSVDASGVIRLEISVNDGAWTLVKYQTPAETAAATYYVDAPTEGTYTMKVRALDMAGNLTVTPGTVTAAIDSTKPVITAAWAERVERGTDTDLTKVHISQTATLYATVVEAASGIPVVLDFNDTTNVITVTSSNVVVDGTLTMTPSSALLAPILAAIDGKGDLTDAAKVVVGTGTWSKVVQVPSTAGAKTYSVRATDSASPTPLVSTTATVTVNVVSDAVVPVMVSSAVTYQAGIEAKAGDWLIISVNATDDISGVNTVKADLTALNPPSSAGVGRSEDWTSSTATWASPLTGTLVLAAQPLIAYGTTARPDTWHLKLLIGSAVTAGDKTVTITVTDKAGKTATGTVIVKVVTERTHWTVSLASGWNFISLPRTPVDASLAAVLAGTPITEIHTALGDVWQSAQLVGGVWTGTLTRIEAGKGYVALASAAGTLTETFTAPQPLEMPPSVELPARWSLIGFASLALETVKATDVYLSSVAGNWSVVYSPGEGWNSARPGALGTLPEVKASKAYWVFMTKAATLAP